MRRPFVFNDKTGAGAGVDDDGYRLWHGTGLSGGILQRAGVAVARRPLLHRRHALYSGVRERVNAIDSVSALNVQYIGLFSPSIA